MTQDELWQKAEELVMAGHYTSCFTSITLSPELNAVITELNRLEDIEDGLRSTAM